MTVTITASEAIMGSSLWQWRQDCSRRRRAGERLRRVTQWTLILASLLPAPSLYNWRLRRRNKFRCLCSQSSLFAALFSRVKRGLSSSRRRSVLSYLILKILSGIIKYNSVLYTSLSIKTLLRLENSHSLKTLNQEGDSRYLKTPLNERVSFRNRT